LFTGAAVGLLAGGSAWSLVPLGIAALGLFWLRTPVESWIGAAPVRARTPSELRLVRHTALVLAAVSVSALIWLFWGGRNRALLWIGAPGKRIHRSGHRETDMAECADGCSDDRGGGTDVDCTRCVFCRDRALEWHGLVSLGLQCLFAINQIQFVQLRIRAAHTTDRSEEISIGRGFLAGQVILMALLATACAGHLFPCYAAIAFLPVLLRGFVWFATESKPLAIQALGKSELVYAGTFGMLLVLGMQLP